MISNVTLNIGHTFNLRESNSMSVEMGFPSELAPGLVLHN